jgi:hypothetical protein
MKIIIDGSNVVRVLGKDHPNISILTALLKHLSSQSIEFVVFLDAWLSSDIKRRNEDQYHELEQLILVYKTSIERGTGGQEADEPLLTFAQHNPTYVILTRDRYRKYWAKFPWLVNSPRLMPFNYVERAAQLLIPALALVVEVKSELPAAKPVGESDHNDLLDSKETDMPNLDNPFPGAQAAPRGAGQADIVFCLDRTGSMQPCIDAVKASIVRFVTQDLQSEGDINFRLRLIAYGDLVSVGTGVHEQDKNWLCSEFTDDVSKFGNDLKGVRAAGGGHDTAMESTLDAIYIASRSAWRTNVHRVIIVFTDEDTYPNLSSATASHAGQDGVNFVIQKLQELRHLSLFLVAPDCAAYKQINGAIRSAERQTQWLRLKTIGAGRIDTSKVDWTAFLAHIGKAVSTTASRVTPQF